jgi:hypothetical protein
VSEAYLRRQRKPNDLDTWQYVQGARAALHRNVERGDDFRNAILGNAGSS